MKLFFKQSVFFLNHTDIIPPKSYYEKNHITDSSKFWKKETKLSNKKKEQKKDIAIYTLLKMHIAMKLASITSFLYKYFQHKHFLDCFHFSDTTVTYHITSLSVYQQYCTQVSYSLVCYLKYQQYNCTQSILLTCLLPQISAIQLYPKYLTHLFVTSSINNTTVPKVSYSLVCFLKYQQYNCTQDYNGHTELLIGKSMHQRV